MKSTFVFPLIAFSFLCLCVSSLGQTNVGKLKSLEQESLIPVNFNDTNYSGVNLYATDTVTSDCWAVKYLVKKDNTRYHDIYIEWSKGNFRGLFKGSDILQMRRYFIPVYVGETNSHLFLTQACATDCSAVLVLFKDGSNRYFNYQNVVAFNVQFGLILFASDESYNKSDNVFELVLVNVAREKQYQITFNSICTAVNMASCVDTVVFEEHKVVVKARLRKSISSDIYMQRTKTIDLAK